VVAGWDPSAGTSPPEAAGVLELSSEAVAIRMSSRRLSKILIEGGRENGKGEVDEPPPERRRAGGTAVNGALNPEKTSLYDDTFSRAKPTGPWMKLSWAAMVAAVVVAVVLTVFRGPVDLRINLDSAEPVVASGEMGLEPIEEAEGADPSPVAQADSTAPPGVAASSAPTRQTEAAAPGEAVAARAPSAPEASVGRSPAPGVESVRREPVRAPAPPLESSPPEESGATVLALNTVGSVAESERATPELSRAHNAAPVEIRDSREEPESEPIQAGGDSSEALQLLVANSNTASRLLDGGFSTLVFRDWRVVQSTSQEVWVDLIAGWTSGGTDVHFIWSVDRDTGAVRPLSQAARNLEAGGESSR
jgi:hypothetical protein